MVDGMVPALNAIKMIHTVARYYNTSRALTTLLASVASQVIVRCRAHLLQGKGDGFLWEEAPAAVVASLDECRAVQDAFIAAFEETRVEVGALAAAGNGRAFDVDELTVFGKIQLFGRRTAKLSELFTTTKQFLSLESSKIDGIDDVVRAPGTRRGAAGG